ncbi:MAG: CRISPR-associated endonuclease Cas2 [Cetobacterium sp.]
MYDITDNSIRNRVIKYLHGTGFLRVQKSVFLGNFSENSIKELEKNLSEIINIVKDSIYIFPLCEREYHDCVFMDKRKRHNILDKNVAFL